MFVKVRSVSFRNLALVIVYGVLTWFFCLYLFLGLVRFYGVEYGLYNLGDVLIPRHPVFSIYFINAVTYFIVGVLIQLVFNSKGIIVVIVAWLLEANFQFFFVGVYFNWNAPVSLWIIGSLLNVLTSMFLIVGAYSLLFSRKRLRSNTELR